ncbi:MAG: hypothetical protein RLZ98_211 [Pseudomonadota bacterium]
MQSDGPDFRPCLAPGVATRVLSTGVVAGVIAVLFDGRTMPFVLAVLVAMTALVAACEGQLRRSIIYLSPVTIAFSLLAAWMAVTGFWAPDGLDAATKATVAMLFVLGVHFVAGWLSLQRDERVALLSFWLLAGFAFGAVYLLAEVVTGLEIKRQIMNAIGSSPQHAYFTYENGRIVAISPNALARSMTVLALLLWPMLCLCRLLFGSKNGWVFPMLLYAVVVSAILLSRSDSNKLAVIVSSGAFLLLMVQVSAVRKLVGLGWFVAVVAMLPLALFAFDNRLYHAEWLPKSAQDRVVIWGHTARQTFKSPIIGAGAHAAYWRGREERTTAEPPPGGHRQVMTLSTHAHNVYLQVWFELGAIGVILLLVSGMLALQQSTKLAPVAGAHATTTFVALMVVIFSTWGAFQYWFMASFAMVAICLALGQRFAVASDACNWTSLVSRTLRGQTSAVAGTRRH